uniref:ATP synthase subunit a n=1 Tax=Bourletiella arvalis TaxID=2049373 RepID=A0A384XIC4_9HEXA|nr:ATP synthase F0 subunit 6 [Bourletiella arvalis]ATP01403.1 ATP synthase F0 subunit 6 [Bourletiella arvalis]
MMSNLFSIFDPSTSMNTSINWISSIMFIFIISSSMWAVSSKMMIALNAMKMSLFNEFKVILGKSSPNGSLIILISLFSFILFNNFMGLYPYIFTSTSHMTITLSMALPLWMGMMIYGWINQTIYMFAHLVPQSTPGVLMPFMVLIESISNMIRPGTLAVRLTANMIAGHLLMTLLGNQTASSSGVILLVLINVQMLLIILEMAVSIIQSYVFTVLMTLYTSEIHSH